MSCADAAPTAPLRGTAVGAASAALSVAAHGMGGGAVPQVSSLTLLIAVCAAVGAVVATLPGLARGPLALVGALAAGQLSAHTAMTLTVHSHSASPGLAMLGAHIGATFVCALLVLAAERLFHVLGRALRAVLVPPTLPVVGTRRHAISTGIHRRPIDEYLRAAISRRGPPLPV
ncbi:hypothetical protein ABH922_004818 [Rhodococcus sp. 27YEA15]|uniref:hypothetical protein n=1 Tax=Rhodococcus sp. 27YEA15 TaxID=3156259 RepID=UPI003C7ABDE7